MESGEGDLRGVEELGAVFVRHGFDEHPVRGAGDEIADAFIVNERGHGVAVGCVRIDCGGDSVFAFRSVGLVAGLPGFAASGDGGACERRTRCGAGFE